MIKKIKNKIIYSDVAKALESGFKENFKVKFIKDSLTEEESKLAKKLEKNKYTKQNWNIREVK